MSHPYQNHITVVIGNPDEKFQTKVSETAFDECRTEEEVWIEYVLRTFDIGLCSWSQTTRVQLIRP